MIIPITQIAISNTVRIGWQKIPFFVHTSEPVNEFILFFERVGEVGQLKSQIILIVLQFNGIGVTYIGNIRYAWVHQLIVNVQSCQENGTFGTIHGLYFRAGYGKTVSASQINISVFRIEQQTGKTLIRHILLTRIHRFPVDNPKPVRGRNPYMVFDRCHGQNLVIIKVPERNALPTGVFRVDTHYSPVKSYPKHTFRIT